jgi:hypothetical protein
VDWAPLARKPAATDGRFASAGSGSIPAHDGTRNHGCHVAVRLINSGPAQNLENGAEKDA